MMSRLHYGAWSRFLKTEFISLNTYVAAVGCLQMDWLSSFVYSVTHGACLI